jgi:hypothetical protein
MNDRNRRLAIILGCLQIFIGLGGVPSGLILALNPSGSGMGFSLDLLQGTPFSSYLIPGLFLFTVNGVATLGGGVATFLKYRYSGEIAIALGALLMAWIVIQVGLIGLVHWMQPLYLGLGLIELILGIIVRRDLSAP